LKIRFIIKIKGFLNLSLIVFLPLTNFKIVPNPLVSICVPTYNGERYLRECLDSILQQTYSNYEVLMVDDCSSDDTFIIAQAYAVKDNRIKLFKNEQNLGLVGNWNRCVKLAQGKWIKFVFQDDLITPTCLEKMVEIGETGVPFVYGLRDFIFEKTESALIKWFKEHNEFVATVFDGQTLVTPELFSTAVLANPFYNLIGEPTSVLLRRDVFDQFDLFNPNLIQLCDAEYWNRVGTQVGAGFIAEPLVTFRVHGGSTTMQNKKKIRLKLEHVIYQHELTFHPQYETLRHFAAKNYPTYSFRKALSEKAQRTLLWIQLRGGKSARKEWKKLLEIYPALEQWSKPKLNVILTILMARLKKSSK